jgi:hypothetical protein
MYFQRNQYDRRKQSTSIHFRERRKRIEDRRRNQWGLEKEPVLENKTRLVSFIAFFIAAFLLTVAVLAAFNQYSIVLNFSP